MHPKLADVIVDLCRRREAQGDCPGEPAPSVEMLEGCVLELARRFEALRVDRSAEFGCFTGDCPHETQAECDAAIRASWSEQANDLSSARARITELETFDIRAALADYGRRKSVAVLDRNWERASDLREYEFRLERIVKDLAARTDSKTEEPET